MQIFYEKPQGGQIVINKDNKKGFFILVLNSGSEKKSKKNYFFFFSDESVEITTKIREINYEFCKPSQSRIL